MDTYKNSLCVAKLSRAQQQHQPLRVAALDIDETWTGKPADQLELRGKLEERGYAIACITSRISYMCVTNQFTRNLGDQTKGLLDLDLIASSTGTELLVKQPDARYLPDENYLKSLPVSSAWQAQVKKLLQGAQEQSLHFSFPTDPLPFRFQLLFPSAQDLDLLLAFFEKQSPASHPVNLTDESERFRKPPRYSIFLTPSGFNKASVVDHVISALTRTLSVAPQSIELLLAGNSLAETAMGFFSGSNTQATFIIPGGASLFSDLNSPILGHLRQQMTKTKNHDSLPTGVYWFPKGSRTVIIGDEAFPGTRGPETLIAYLSQHT